LAADIVRLQPEQARGHYESFFQRANHPQRPLAFWIRYTLLVPAGNPDLAVGEVWATFFDGERGAITAVKERHRLSECELVTGRLGLRIGTASLEEGSLRGTVTRGEHRIGWALDYEASDPPLLLLPARLYESAFPKAKSLVGAPRARFAGAIEVDGRSVDVNGWLGSHNHNWGERHTERYAWAQVVGFDNAPDAFLECASARVRVGPILAPTMSVLVLRLDGEEYALNSLWTAARASARIEALDFQLHTSARGVRIRAHLHAPPSAFIGLDYEDPSGAHKLCLNSKLAHCKLVVERPGERTRVLQSEHRAAFELLGFPPHPEVRVAV
jgi:hypothetical protein